MNILEAVTKRRSIRKFADKNISDSKIKKIIYSGTYAPSACDMQGWKFIVINDDRIKRRLIEKGTISFIKNAPIGIVVLYNNQTDNIEYQDHIQSASAAIQNMLLTAHSLGIGSCWICHLPRKQSLRKILNIPCNYDPIAYIAMGYYKDKPKKRPRRYTIEELISYNKFRFDTKKIPWTKLVIRRNLIRAYRILPFKKVLLPITKKFEKFN